ncbi:hypothetical protein [Acinetobacter soli]|uniref:hypothetical protein n=1 Tax=Acinetobacter soli TaxID=487316 RepID=UPI000E5AD7CF|nr:hypothetical protein [Acinetobacter soli]
MKKLGFIFTFIFLLSACHPLDAKQQQQDYICQSMIQGYLKMQQLYDFRLWQRESHTPNQVRYQYRPASEHGMLIGTLKTEQLVFECSQNQNLFRIQRPNEHASLLQVQLPSATQSFIWR